MDHQPERAAVAQPDGAKMADVPRGDPPDAEIFCERDDRTVHEAESKIREAAVDLHRASELIERRRRVCERPTREIVHERLHATPLVAKEVIDLGQNQGRDVPGARSVDLFPKAPMIRRALDEVVDEGTSVADQRRRVSGGH